MLRAIREIAPSYVVGENVYGIVNWDGGLVFDEVQADLESEGYEVLPVILPAASVNAPHKRDRVWFIAYSNAPRCKNRNEQYRREQTHGGERKLSSCGHSVGIDSNASNTGIESMREREDKLYESEFSSNSENFGLQRSEQTNGEKGKKPNDEQFNGCSRKRIDAWEQFPTQSPICGRDDGLSSRLDGITFSKWRNESIKAYGNAIVPQVAFELFRVIEKLNKTL